MNSWYTEVLRRGWDSNPRYRCRYTTFPGWPVQPLLHLSRDTRERENVQRTGWKCNECGRLIFGLFPLYSFRAFAQIAMLKRLLKRMLFFGTTRYCPVCRGRIRRFKPSGFILRQEARCAVCNSLERHRLAWIFFQDYTDLFNNLPKRMLHIAPEEEFSRLLKNVPGLQYVSADLADPRAMVKVDITSLSFPDGVFDVVYCSHVLEHVRDDRKAMRELQRVMKPSGWGVVLVPITSGETLENDPSVTSDEDRTRIYGQPDHVRLYGRDFSTRLQEEGFSVREVRCRNILSPEVSERCGLADDELYFVTKE